MKTILARCCLTSEVVAILLVVFAPRLASAQPAPAVSCQSLADTRLPATSIGAAQEVSGGSFTPPNSTNVGSIAAHAQVRVEKLIQDVPEPSSLVLASLSIAVIGSARRWLG